jgi:acid phosphatase (class A)
MSRMRPLAGRACLALLLAVLFAPPVLADWTSLSDKDFPIDPPPAEGSAETRKDLDELVAMQAARTPEQCALARAQKIPDLHSLFAGAGVVTDAELAKEGPLLSQASQLLSSIVSVYKNRFARKRPYDEDARVTPCAEKPAGATSYPSYHAAAGVLDGCLLSNLHPKRAEKLAERGRLVGELRLIGGVHHRGDVEAGRSLGARFCAALLDDAGFRADLDALR